MEPSDGRGGALLENQPLSSIILTKYEQHMPVCILYGNGKSGGRDTKTPSHEMISVVDHIHSRKYHSPTIQAINGTIRWEGRCIVGISIIIFENRKKISLMVGLI